MQVLLINAHPVQDLYGRALLDAAVVGLRRADHCVDVVDLYTDGFSPAMTVAECLAYDTDTPIVDEQVRRYADLVMAAEAIVFVYPTWRYGQPAILKGWCDRVMVNGVSSTIVNGRLKPGLQNVRRLVGVTTYESTRSAVRVFNDAGRRSIMRTLRLVCHPLTRTKWLGLYRFGESSDAKRSKFLTKVERAMVRL